MRAHRHPHTPAWARGAPSARYGTPPTTKEWTLPPTDPAYFHNFARTMAQAFKSKVAAYEIGNEVNECFGWRGTAQQYRDTMLAPGFDAIKGVDPSLIVVAPALFNSANFDPWLTYVDGSGHRYLTRSIDVYSLHTYESVTDTRAHLAAATPYSRCGTDGRCLGPFWLTEFGYGSNVACGAATDPAGPGQALVDVLAACYGANLRLRQGVHLEHPPARLDVRLLAAERRRLAPRTVREGRELHRRPPVPVGSGQLRAEPQCSPAEGGVCSSSARAAGWRANGSSMA